MTLPSYFPPLARMDTNLACTLTPSLESLASQVLRKIDLHGFNGTEGITHVTGSLFAFTEESEHNIVIVDLGCVLDKTSII